MRSSDGIVHYWSAFGVREKIFAKIHDVREMCERCSIQKTKLHLEMWERDGEWNLKTNKIMVDMGKSRLHIAMHVWVWAWKIGEMMSDSEDVFISAIRAGERKMFCHMEGPCPMWVEVSRCQLEWGGLHMCELSRWVCERWCPSQVGSPMWDVLSYFYLVRACHRDIKGKLRKIILYCSRGKQKERR